MIARRRSISSFIRAPWAPAGRREESAGVLFLLGAAAGADVSRRDNLASSSLRRSAVLSVELIYEPIKYCLMQLKYFFLSFTVWVIWVDTLYSKSYVGW